MASENALREFKTAHAEGIAATKAEFVKFLREGELPEESLDLVALYIYVGNRATLKHNAKSHPAGAFFGCVVEDGVYDSIERWDNPKKYAALDICRACGGEGYAPKATGIVASRAKTPEPAPRPRKSKRAVRGV